MVVEEETDKRLKKEEVKRRKSLHISLNCYGYLSCEIKWQRKVRVQESVCIGMNGKTIRRVRRQQLPLLLLPVCWFIVIISFISYFCFFGFPIYSIMMNILLVSIFGIQIIPSSSPSLCALDDFLSGICIDKEHVLE